MTDRHAPWIAAAWTIGLTVLACTLAYLGTHMPPEPDTPCVAPISSITPTNPAPR